jgi:hypothetical protein
MKQEILLQELSKLYPRLNFIYYGVLKNLLCDMYRNKFQKYETEECFMLYKEDMRVHCGYLIIVDTLISTKRGEGAKAIEYLIAKYQCPLQLDCHIDNEAIEFYEKQGFKKRAWSLIR